MNSMKKGSQWERDICKKLSLWWTEDKRDDVFWRTAGSGARATQRAKKQKKTYGQCGDVQAIDPIGEPLTKLCSIEIKRGYSQNSFADLIENQAHLVKAPMYFQFILQARKECKQAGTYAWMIIAKRDRRMPIIIIPAYFYRAIRKGLCTHFYAKIKTGYGGSDASIYVTTLDWFFDMCPDVIKNLYEDMKEG